MDYTPRTIAELSAEHPEYSSLAPQWRTIDALSKGFPAIQYNIQKYLPLRPAEDVELYKLRIAKLAYSPIMSRLVNTYVGKLIEAGVDFPENVDKLWDDLRIDNSAPGSTKRSEMSLVSEILTSLLSYGRVHVAVDIPDVKARSNFELRQSKVRPYFTVLSPLEVINWGDGWMVLKQFVQRTLPFQPASTFALFTYVGENERAVYEVPVKLADMVDAENNLYPSIHRVYWGKEWAKPDENMKFPVTKVSQGTGLERFSTARVDDSKWLCSALANKQVQHLRIENAWSDAGYLSGTVQRVFTPEDAKPTDDPRVTYSKSKGTNEALAKAGNQHILVGKGYSFVESTGTALANLQQMLDKIEMQMKETANLHFASGDKGTLQQSGASKKADMSLLEGNLTDLGSLVLSIYNELLAKVATMFKLAPVEANGLNDFADNNITEVTTAITAVSTLPDFPALGKAFLYRKLLEDMDISFSDADRLELEKQLLNPPEPVVVATNTPSFNA